ncbi:pentapeptide repeat-containing protein [Dolichospermum sp. FACHB-1091]|uniref:pentapeptide repeat-containing protein n=1 Tax=Dolichospermum sp. FACHB-1091 TaxID=2692798 RepID=UPI0016801747|nr:pentapeptide repeat-containing protein [Dolichospermum sp. FACHB-1091]MBD2442820.1 pentapeptide repeat-containing protein [Dolichospermum sp. FACHB-1091]
MISSQVEMEDMELLKLYNKGERDFGNYKIIGYTYTRSFYPTFANLCNEDIRGINLDHSHLWLANLENVILENSTIRNAELFNIKLINSNLIGVDFSGSNLDQAQMKGSVLRASVLRDAILASTNLKNTNLSGADLSGSDLHGGYLENANLSGAKLRGTNLEGIKLENTDFSGADLTDACLDHTYLKGMIIDNNTKMNQKYHLIWEITNKESENRNLSGKDLSRANLSGAILIKADFRGTDLTDANLTGADLTDANLTGADLTGADLTGADLTDANLTGADLTGADLRRAKLQCANLRGANLKMSKIANANFAEANFCDTDLSQTHNKLTTVSTLKDAYYNDETKFPERLHPTNVHKIAQKAAQKISQMIWSNYQDPQWIKELLNNKGEPQKYPPSREKQQEFKEELIKKYGYKCLISGCEIKEIIEAAHIIPYSKIESHDVANGLLLRVDLHRLFDAHLIAIHPITRKVLISEQIAKDYQDIRGIKIASCLTGEDATKQQDALRYHYEQCNWINKRLLE